MVLNFFRPYKDALGQKVKSHRKIAIVYLKVTEGGFERAPVLSCSCLTDRLLSLTHFSHSARGLWPT